MDLNLLIKSRTEDSLVASYTCPCGCNPRLAYHKDGAHDVDGCCCGNEFAVGPDAATRLLPRHGFRQEVQDFRAPWGEPLQAVWTIGASTHSEESPHDPGHHALPDDEDEHHHHSSGHASHDHHDHSAPAIDPVCGMTVDPETARTKDLHLVHAGRDYYFCGKGCKLEFGDDPARYLDPSYSPSM